MTFTLSAAVSPNTYVHKITCSYDAIKTLLQVIAATVLTAFESRADAILISKTCIF